MLAKAGLIHQKKTFHGVAAKGVHCFSSLLNSPWSSRVCSNRGILFSGFIAIQLLEIIELSIYAGSSFTSNFETEKQHPYQRMKHM